MMWHLDVAAAIVFLIAPFGVMILVLLVAVVGVLVYAWRKMKAESKASPAAADQTGGTA